MSAPVPRLHSPVAVAMLVLATSGPSFATSLRVAEGERAWRERAGDFARTGRVPAEPVERALEVFEQAAASSPGDLDLRFQVMEALYFKGYFVVEQSNEKKRIFERLARLAEETVSAADSFAVPSGASAQVEEAVVRAHFWAAVAWGLWGMSHSRFASGTKGVAARIRDHAQKVISLDEEFGDAGGLRLLGRLHTVTPKVPFLTGWIDRAKGLSLLDRAYRLSNRDLRNGLFLAEAILKYRPQDRNRALELLREVGARSPDPDYLAEQTETLVEARRLLAVVEGGR